jgi:hypothetical protein
MTGTGDIFWAISNAAAVAVLQAMTIALTLWDKKKSRNDKKNSLTWARDRDP